MARRLMRFRARRPKIVTVRLDKDSIEQGAPVLLPGPIVHLDWCPPATGPEIELSYEFPTHDEVSHDQVAAYARVQLEHQGLSVLAIRVERE